MNTAELREICVGALREGRQRHSLAVGIVSHIYDDKYAIFAVDSETGIPQAGDVFDVQAVYCREVIESKRSLAITQVDSTPGMRLHPLYEYIPCETYISSPLIVDGEIWGTLNYTGFEVREIPFSASDIAYNETQAAFIASTIEKAEL